MYKRQEKTCSLAFANGYTSVKLYFMMGLPTETMEDIEGIAETAQKVVDLFYSNPKHAKGRGVQVTISCAVSYTHLFIHPITGEHLRFDSELPEYFTHFIASLRRGIV